MTVLVDAPRWWWRGQRWAHLVSDDSYGELHRFAAGLGLRRLAFQGDHYDLPEHLHGRAQQEGAVFVDSRELVRRLRAAGLRHRGPARCTPRWRQVLDADPGALGGPESLAALIDAALAEPGAGATVAGRSWPMVSGARRLAGYLRHGELTLAFELPEGIPPPAPELFDPPVVDCHVTVPAARALVELVVDTSSGSPPGRS